MFADHLLALFLIAFAPILGRWSWLRLRRALAERKEGARLTAYSEIIITEWVLAAALLIVWVLSGRTADAAGLLAPLSPKFLITALVVIAVSALLLMQVRSIRALGTEATEGLRRQMESVEALLPHTSGERSVFMAVSGTAGFCEELLYRGFLVGYLANFLGTAGAVVASAAVFGLAHAYQGRAGIVKTGAVGLVMGLIYVVSGSIWPCVVLHTALDIQGGLMGFAVFGRADEPVSLEPQPL